MTEMKNITPKVLLWADLEMTGLNRQKDRIVEVAAIVTDWDFKELGTFESGVRQDEALLKALFAANPWAVNRPENTQDLTALSLSSPPEAEVEGKLMELLDSHCQPGEIALLAGNSIHTDRGFIKHWWPRLDARLHYRMLDVSAWKVVMQGKYGMEFTKKEAHRAMDDIRESIDELKFYLDKAKF